MIVFGVTGQISEVYILTYKILQTLLKPSGADRIRLLNREPEYSTFSRCSIPDILDKPPQLIALFSKLIYRNIWVVNCVIEVRFSRIGLSSLIRIDLV
jgi:hypothetical protein